MSGTHSRVYLVALTVWVLGWVAVLTLPGTTGVGLGVAALSVFASNTVIFAVAWMRVQRGDAWREAPGTVLPVMAEFMLMGFGLRLPAAVANVRNA
jgi:hypothetical protein